jgi:hypothetical protein
MSYANHVAADARLIILRELAVQTDGRLNSTLLAAALDGFGHNRSREWLHTQINALQDIGAVQAVPAGSVLVVSITRIGLEHVHRRRQLDGVAIPTPGVE